MGLGEPVVAVVKAGVLSVLKWGCSNFPSTQLASQRGIGEINTDTGALARSFEFGQTKYGVKNEN